MDDEFDTFWRAYPRKTAKGDARKAWMQTAAIRPPLAKLLEAIDAARRCEQWRRDGGQYIPYPATWLRQERWDDQPIDLGAISAATALDERAAQLKRLADERAARDGAERAAMPDAMRQQIRRVA